MSSELITRTNALAIDWRQYVLGVTFPKSRANAYPAVVAICRGANDYQESMNDGLLYHFAVFGRNPDQIAKALAVVSHAGSITAIQFFARGIPITDVYYLHESLKCFVQSTTCDDQKAHCNRVVNEPKIGTDAYLFPCSYLIRNQARLEINSRHPATIRDQIQASAVQYGFAWCPNFDPDDFRKV